MAAKKSSGAAPNHEIHKVRKAPKGGLRFRDRDPRWIGILGVAICALLIFVSTTYNKVGWIMGTHDATAYVADAAGLDLGDGALWVDSARLVAAGDVDLGILICGTGVGISLAANKVKGIRAVVCSEPYSAKLSRQHNNTNILAFGARVIGIEMAKMIVDEWLNAEFMGGRHQTRVDMIMEIEEKQSLEGAE